MPAYDKDMDCSVEIGVRQNGRDDSFPHHYYVRLCPVDGSLDPVEVGIPVDLYQDLIDMSGGSGSARFGVHVGPKMSRLEITVDLYAGKDEA